MERCSAIITNQMQRTNECFIYDTNYNLLLTLPVDSLEHRIFINEVMSQMLDTPNSTEPEIMRGYTDNDVAIDVYPSLQ